MDGIGIVGVGQKKYNNKINPKAKKKNKQTTQNVTSIELPKKLTGVRGYSNVVFGSLLQHRYMYRSVNLFEPFHFPGVHLFFVCFFCDSSFFNNHDR